jgi:hypothetical protein
MINIIITLVWNLFFKGFNIYMDNFFSLVQTFRYIYNKEINIIKTMQMN